MAHDATGCCGSPDPHGRGVLHGAPEGTAPKLAKRGILGVDPRRLELVTSAMRRQREEFATVRLRSKTPANKHIHPKLLSPVFAVVRLGWCHFCHLACKVKKMLVIGKPFSSEGYFEE